VDLGQDVKPMTSVAVLDPETGALSMVHGEENIHRRLADNHRAESVAKAGGLRGNNE
jgi:hypothetical protein